MTFVQKNTSAPLPVYTNNNYSIKSYNIKENNSIISYYDIKKSNTIQILNCYDLVNQKNSELKGESNISEIKKNCDIYLNNEKFLLHLNVILKKKEKMK